MSTKYGSEERGRDPDSPDTLAERLASERDRRAAARELFLLTVKRQYSNIINT